VREEERGRRRGGEEMEGKGEVGLK